MSRRFDRRVPRGRDPQLNAGSFTCPVCQARSYHPDDVRYGYCGRCHAFTGADPVQVAARGSDGPLAAEDADAGSRLPRGAP